MDSEVVSRFEVPDLRLAESEGPRLRRSLVAAHIGLEMLPGAVAIHYSLLASVRDRLSGRGAVVWQDQNEFNMSFGVFSHGDRDQVEVFADGVARSLGARVIFATTVGMVASVDAGWLQFELSRRTQSYILDVVII